MGKTVDKILKTFNRAIKDLDKLVTKEMEKSRQRRFDAEVATSSALTHEIEANRAARIRDRLQEIVE